MVQHPLTKFKQAQLTQIIGEKYLSLTIICTNWKNKRYRKCEYCCFVFHKLSTYFSQGNNFKRARIRSLIYMLQMFSTHISSQFNPFKPNRNGTLD